MKKFLQKRLKNEKGLTLVELLAVIVILGIISAIAVPSIGGIITTSKVNALKADGQMVLNAANLYFVGQTNTATAPTTETVTIVQLKAAGFLDDTGGFVATDATVVVTKESGGNTISGTAKKGATTVVFANATNADINAAGTATTTNGKVIITR